MIFIATKGRWNWKNIAARTLLGTLAFVTLLTAAVYVYFKIEARPKPLAVQTVFWDISITATKSDVKSKKGEPSQVFESGERETWVYAPQRQNVKDNEIPWGAYSISFRGEKIQTISYISVESLGSPSLLGIRTSDSFEKIIKALGEPSSISASNDALKHRIAYTQYNAYFTLERNAVWQLGIFNPEFPAPSYQ